MNQKHLAIASVPVQKWNSLSGPDEALLQGTVFPELVLPFFASGERAGIGIGNGPDPGLRNSILENLEKSGPQQKEEDLLRKIQEISFTVDDLRLYLDTHPKEPQGLEALKAALQKQKGLLQEFALSFYPLTMDSMTQIYEQNPQSTCYCWSKGPMPWEGACV